MKKLIVFSLVSMFSVGALAAGNPLQSNMAISSKGLGNQGRVSYVYSYSGQIFSFASQLAMDQSIARLRADKNFVSSRLAIQGLVANRSE